MFKFVIIIIIIIAIRSILEMNHLLKEKFWVSTTSKVLLFF